MCFENHGGLVFIGLTTRWSSLGSIIIKKKPSVSIKEGSWFFKELKCSSLELNKDRTEGDYTYLKMGELIKILD